MYSNGEHLTADALDHLHATCSLVRNDLVKGGLINGSQQEMVIDDVVRCRPVRLTLLIEDVLPPTVMDASPDPPAEGESF